MTTLAAFPNSRDEEEEKKINELKDLSFTSAAPPNGNTLQMREL